jgi:hypothetical protein
VQCIFNINLDFLPARAPLQQARLGAENQILMGDF